MQSWPCSVGGGVWGRLLLVGAGYTGDPCEAQRSIVQPAPRPATSSFAWPVGSGADFARQLVDGHRVHRAAVVRRDHVEILEDEPVLVARRPVEAHQLRVAARIQVLHGGETVG